mgnify:CR=1 FL=1
MNASTASVNVLKIGLSKAKDDALLLGFFKDKVELAGEIKLLDNVLGGIISRYIKDGNFKGEKSEVKVIYTGNNIKNVVLVGLGEEDKFSFEILSGVIAGASRKLRDGRIESFSVFLDSFNNKKLEDESVVEKIVLSSLIGMYQFTEYKTKDKDKIKRVKQVTLITGSGKNFENGLMRNLVIADAVNKTRDLVNTPPNIATPEYVSDYAKGLARKSGLKCTVFDERQILEMKMGCLDAVGKGSVNKPRLVVIEYKGAGKERAIAIVGKGVTFDSGGLNVKPYPYILNMKDDMAGAAAAMHVIESCAKLKLPLNLTVVAPLCENMIDADSYRPDDVLTAYNGMTVEIKNTDAEGRLILADALSYAAKTKPLALIDIATLTGASTIVLGSVGTPFLSTDEKLSERLKNASKSSLEKLWELPLWPEYEESIKSDVADIKNISEEGDAGVIMGAIFLKNFVGDSPWAHIDIGTTVWSKAEKGMLTKGATGATVRLMMDLLINWKA